MATKSAKYRKLRDGGWGVMVDGIPVHGEAVLVTKKSGEQSAEIVGKLVWKGTDDRSDGREISLWTILKGEPDTPVATPHPEPKIKTDSDEEIPF